MRLGVFGFGMMAALAGCVSTPEIALHCESPMLDESWSRIAPHVPAQSDASRLIDALLCLTESPASEKYVRSRIAAQVHSSSYATGESEESSSLLDRDQVDRLHLFEGSDEWKYFVRLMDGQVYVEAENEACVVRTVIEHDVDAGWQIVRLEDACD